MVFSSINKSSNTGTVTNINKNNCEYFTVTKPSFIAPPLSSAAAAGFGAETDGCYELSSTLYKDRVSI